MTEPQPTQIGSYRIVRELGRGGMGVVYLAEDPRLGREVAIKALPEDFAADASRLERFEREARTLAQLNHPNVAGIHGVEEHDDRRYLILEYVEGESLADRLDRGPLEIGDAVRIACQIAAGVAAAHDAGVVHRDLKPDNVRITPDDAAKVLDFGLARLDGDNSSASGSSMLSDMATLTSPAVVGGQSPTMPGVILGTAAYMSPEQARGRRVDHRTDVWSFGVVLYEMLVGGSPFKGETVGDSIGAVLHKELDLDQLPAETPARVRRVLERCLKRDRDERYHSLSDARLDMLADEPQAAAGPSLEPGTNASSPRLVLIAIIFIAGIIAGARWFGSSSSWSFGDARPIAASLDAPVNARVLFDGDLAGPPVVSPDGSRVAFAAAGEGEPRMLWVRELDESTPRRLEGTEGALFPFWSPDSRRIGFFTTSTLLRYDLPTDTIRQVCGVNQARGGAWLPDDRIVFAPTFSSGLVAVDAGGGEPEPLTERDDDLHTTHRWPFAVGDDGVLFAALSARPGEFANNGIYYLDLKNGGPPRRVLASDYRAEYHNGRLLHVTDGVLLATRVDLDDGEVSDESTVLARGVVADLSTWHGQFSAGKGVLVYQPETLGAETNASPSWAAEADRLTFTDQLGRPRTTYAEGRPMRGFAVSPSGERVVVNVVSQSVGTDLWIFRTGFIRDIESASPEVRNEALRRGILDAQGQRFTFLEGAEVQPVFSPDGTRVAFRWDGNALGRPRGIYYKPIDGGREVLIRDNGDDNMYPIDWTPDGKYLITKSGSLLRSPENDLYALPLLDEPDETGQLGGELIPVIVDEHANTRARVSPDGRWIAYTKTVDGDNNIYVQPFPLGWESPPADTRVIVSNNGGRLPRWSESGDRIFYISDAGVLIQVPCNPSGAVFEFGAPSAMFQTPYDTGRNYEPFPMRDDGSQDFMFMDSEKRADAPIAALLNWEALLKQEDDQ